jgi:hypothetical protein
MEAVIAILFLIAGAVIAYALKLRYNHRELQHKERLAALEKGAQLPNLGEEQSPWSPRIYLLRGMIWLFSGVGLVIFLGAIVAGSRQPPPLEERLSRAYNLKGLGATDEQIQKAADDPTPPNEAPAGIALLGLVPVGVGIAYLIFYRAESRNPLPRGQAPFPSL